MICGNCGKRKVSIDHVKRCYALRPGTTTYEGTWDGPWKQGPLRDLTRARWGTILDSWDRQCAYCGTPVGTQAEREHSIALDAGGPHSASNIVPACSLCNAEKGVLDGQTYHGLRASRGLPVHPKWHALNPALRDALLADIFATPQTECSCSTDS